MRAVKITFLHSDPFWEVNLVLLPYLGYIHRTN
jgi:hypothetical protein